jgi:predicted metal-dependent hydrolase
MTTYCQQARHSVHSASPSRTGHLGSPQNEAQDCSSGDLNGVSDDAVRLAVVGKLGWIKRQRAKFQAQPRQSQRRMVSGESHYFMGQRYRLRVVESSAPMRVVLRGKAALDLFVRPETGTARRETLLQAFYRAELKKLIPTLLDKWQPILGVEANAWGIKKMKTKWGTCKSPPVVSGSTWN